MIFLNDEKEAILDWVQAFDQIRFDTFLASAGGHRVADFSAILLPMPAIAVAFVGWLEQKPQNIPVIFQAALLGFPHHASAPSLQAAMNRIAQARTKIAAAGPPWRARLIDGIPMVNRAPLRATLESIIAGGRPEVVMVDGPDGTGRSHSWFLIRHVARSTTSGRPIKIDLEAIAIQQRKIETVFDFLARKLQLATRRPSAIGTTVGTLGAAYASEIALAMSEQPLASPAWLVFDHVDDASVDPEIKSFICELVKLRFDGELNNCKIFLLGADRDYGVEDPFNLAELESLSNFLPEELEDAANAINALGAQPKTKAELASWLNPVTCEFLLLGGRHACEHVAKKLVELRMEVRA